MTEFCQKVITAKERNEKRETRNETREMKRETEKKNVRKSNVTVHARKRLSNKRRKDPSLECHIARTNYEEQQKKALYQRKAL